MIHNDPEDKPINNEHTPESALSSEFFAPLSNAPTYNAPSFASDCDILRLMFSEHRSREGLTTLPLVSIDSYRLLTTYESLLDCSLPRTSPIAEELTLTPQYLSLGGGTDFDHKRLLILTTIGDLENHRGIAPLRLLSNYGSPISSAHSALLLPDFALCKGALGVCFEYEGPNSKKPSKIFTIFPHHLLQHELELASTASKEIEDQIRNGTPYVCRLNQPSIIPIILLSRFMMDLAVHGAVNGYENLNLLGLTRLSPPDERARGRYTFEVAGCVAKNSSLTSSGILIPETHVITSHLTLCVDDLGIVAVDSN